MKKEIKYLLDFISIKESGKDYNVVYLNKQNKLPKPITEMTLSELITWQKWLGNKYGSSASGRYQHIRKTLESQIKRLGLSKELIFNPPLQDDLGWDLLIQRGLNKFLSGKMSRTDFGNELAKEWASLPILSNINGKRRGQSYYAGDGLNAAHQKPEKVEQILDTVLKMHRESPESVRTNDGAKVPKGNEISVRPSVSLFDIIVKILRILFRRD